MNRCEGASSGEGFSTMPLTFQTAPSSSPEASEPSMAPMHSPAMMP